jgi:Protein of unknown function (DUF3761)
MFGAEPTSTWWRRPVLLAGAAGLVAGVVIGGASHSLPAGSTHPMGPATGPRATVTVTAGPTVTHTRTVTVSVTNQAPSGAPASVTPVAGRPPAGSSTPSGTVPAAPASTEPVQSGPVALCKDGTLSYALHHQGACAHHGGVAIWYR